MNAPLEAAKLTRQSYGIACAQATFGGPRGIWLECGNCKESQVIVGSRYMDSDPYANITDAQASEIFRRHGWTGDGDRMLKTRCPSCSKAQVQS